MTQPYAIESLGFSFVVREDNSNFTIESTTVDEWVKKTWAHSAGFVEEVTMGNDMQRLRRYTHASKLWGIKRTYFIPHSA